MTDRFLSTIVEIDLPRCALSYGTSPCQATGTLDRACYNTFATCQDKENYDATTVTITLTEVGAHVPPGVLARPYITSIDMAPTEIDPEAGLAKRANCTIQLRDESDSDVEFDPYVIDRLSRAGGTFWSRFKARVNNYAGAEARVIRRYVDAAGNFGEVSTERYIVDQFKGPSKGRATLVLKDPLRLAVKVKIPQPSAGKIAVTFTNNDLQVTLDDSSDYPAAGFIRIKDEIIEYTSNAANVLSWPSGTYRGRYDTTAISAKIGDVVQLCEAFEDTPATEVMQHLLNLAGITDDEIDLAGFAEEEVLWLGDKYLVTTILHEPESADVLLASIVKACGGVMWWSPTQQQIKFRVIAPRSPSDVSGVVLTDEANFIENTVQVERLDNLRITRSSASYDMVSGTANRREGKNYQTTDLFIDTDAESTDEYGDVRGEAFQFHWFGPGASDAMRAFVHRRLAAFRDPPDKITADVDPQDREIAEGQLLDIETADLVDANGDVKRLRCLVLRRDDKGTVVNYTFRTTIFGRRYAFIAPAGHPDYMDANDAEREYAFICGSNGLMSNGDPGYRII